MTRAANSYDFGVRNTIFGAKLRLTILVGDLTIFRKLYENSQEIDFWQFLNMGTK